MTDDDVTLTPADVPSRIRSALDVETMWRALMGPLGFGGHSTWIALLDGERPTRHLLQIEECDGMPDTEPEHVARVLSHLADAVDQPRFAFLRSRPGSGAPDAEDQAWISLLYAACRVAGVPSEVVHLAHDHDVLPVPMDALAA